MPVLSYRPGRLQRGVRRVPLTVGLALALGAAEVGYRVLPAAHADRLAAWASTNVDRLTTEPVGPLVASVFVVQDHPLFWLALAVLGCSIVEANVGWRRTLLVAVVAHLSGTVVSEAIVWWRVGHGRLPLGALHQVDVGASYVGVGLVSAAVVVGRAVATKVIAALTLAAVAPLLLEGLTSLDVSAVGHLTAFVVVGIFQWVSLVRESRKLRIQSPQPTRTV